MSIRADQQGCLRPPNGEDRTIESNPNIANRGAFLLGDRVVRPSLNQIERGGRTLTLEPKAMQTLLLLVARAGEVVPRQELLDEIWGDCVVGDETLTRLISQLRKALGDSTRSPGYIATIYKTGYRLVAQVTPVPPPDPSPSSSRMPPPPAAAAAGPPPGDPARFRRRKLALVPLGVVLAAVVWWGLRGEAPLIPGAEAPRARPVTAMTGTESMPAVTADGTRLAFVRRLAGEVFSSIWIKDLQTDSLVQATPAGVFCRDPQWSPDGRRLAYLRFGGVPQVRIMSLDGAPDTVVHYQPFTIQDLNWSPDGQMMAFTAQDGPRLPARTRLLDLRDGSVTALDLAPDARQHLHPAFDPDGRRLAYAEERGNASTSLQIRDLSDGRRRTVFELPYGCGGLAWTPDGQALVVSAALEEEHVLALVDLRSGQMTPIAAQGSEMFSPVVSADGRLLFYADSAREVNLWKVGCGAASGSGETSPPERFAASTRGDAAPDLSPDGLEVAFLSDRSGHTEIWLAPLAGGDPRRLTHFEGPWLRRPLWSPEGDRLAVTSVVEGRNTVFLVDAGSGEVTPLAALPGQKEVGDDDRVLCWGAGGGRLYVSSDRGGRARVWRLDLQAGGAEPILPGRQGLIGEVGGGTALLYSRQGPPGLQLIPLAGGEVRDIDQPPQGQHWFQRRATADGFDFWQPLAGGSLFAHYALASGRIDTLAVVPGNTIMHYTVSADRTRLIYALMSTVRADIMVLKDWDPRS